MRYDEFLARVRERGEYTDQAEAEHVTQAVLAILAQRITPDEAKNLAAQLPGDLGQALEVGDRRNVESYGVEEFLGRIARRTGARPRTAEWDAGAVLSTLADTVSDGEVDDLLAQLPSGFPTLFGKPEEDA
ncbi:DUF2267 domain-containing protein [Streptomyces sp. URMC 123]|uniref:DUF2267 domain-containing protein n=1 Tax=Streptomyces sp. URMC 123 TaxID=3423403 RepID=UPI003F1BA9B3